MNQHTKARMTLFRIAKGVLTALCFPLAVILYLCRIRLVRITIPDRIGHLCIEPDCFLKEGALGLRPGFIGILIAPRHVVANRTLLDLWRRRTIVASSPLLCRLLSLFSRYTFVHFPLERYATAIGETADCGRILAAWGDRAPLLRKEWVDSQAGWDTLRELGMPPGSWFVCVHSRDGFYSLSDEHLHDYRNSSIESYFLAMREIVQRGGWCVRVGEPTPNPLPVMPGVIDYANSRTKSDWMDVFLCAHCRFFLGNSSGLYLLSAVFGVPAALANLIPLSGALPVIRGGVGIPKLLRSARSGELLGFREVLDSPVGNFRYASQYRDAGILIEENSPEDVRDLAIEMLDSQGGTPAGPPGREELQARFKSLVRHGHYSFGSDSRIGSAFLEKYARLL